MRGNHSAEKLNQKKTPASAGVFYFPIFDCSRVFVVNAHSRGAQKIMLVVIRGYWRRNQAMPDFASPFIERGDQHVRIGICRNHEHERIAAPVARGQEFPRMCSLHPQSVFTIWTFNCHASPHPWQGHHTCVPKNLRLVQRYFHTWMRRTTHVVLGFPTSDLAAFA